MFDKKWPLPKSVLHYLTLSRNKKNKYINKKNETILGVEQTDNLKCRSPKMEILHERSSNMAASVAVIRDRVISVRTSSNVTEMTQKLTTTTS